MEISENRGQLVHAELEQRKHALPIETPHLTLRAFREADVDPLFAIQGDHEAMRYTYAASSRQDCVHWLRTFAALDSTLGFAPWTVVLRTEARVIGWGGLSIDPFDPGWGIEVSYFFHPAYWGRGYATELVHATLQHGFGILSLPAIGAFVRPANVASVRVLEKCGFTLLGYEPRLERNRYEVQRAAWLSVAKQADGGKYIGA
jgi:[ribosomal protein S5]-alanine N-acetyltransferase